MQAHQRGNKAAIPLVQRADDTDVKGRCFAKAKLVIETATTLPTPPIRRSNEGEKYGFDSLMCQSCDTFVRVSGSHRTTL